QSTSSEQNQEQIADFEIADAQLALALAGPGGQHLQMLGRELDVSIGQRGTTLRLRGNAENVARARRILGELVSMLGKQEFSEADLSHAVRALNKNPELQINDLTDEVVIKTVSQRAIAPKSVNQKRYIQAIREHDIVFGIGPAGTGKTYLAMAMAVRA